MKATHHNQAPSAEFAQIIQEVKQHGFYALMLNEFLPEIKNREEQMFIICVMAKQAQLRASFNLDKNLVVLER